NLRATHGRASFSSEGRCAILQDGGYRLELGKLTADRMDVDQELLAALPGGFGQSLARFPLEGPVNGQGKITIAAPPQPNAAPQVSWEMELDVENGRLLTMTPIEHIHGGLTV